MNHQKHIQHLFWRVGFGLNIPTWQRIQHLSIPEITKQLFQQSASFQDISVLGAEGINSLRDFVMLPPDERKNVTKKRLEGHKRINEDWREKMIGKGVLREKMALFWHGHFACREKNPVFSQQQINTLREHALGNFGDLLHAIAKDPAMLKFLNNKQNRKTSPNENFARELLELFTLGIGNYTEQDIKEAARAFTGWNFDEEGNFTIRQRQHDEGQKTFMGKTGNLNGTDIINIVLKNPQTAKFVCAKIYRYFVNEQVNPSIVKELANYFYQTNYNISQLLRRIFTADWFYEEQNIGAKIKSPIELLVGFSHQFNLTFNNYEAPIYIQKALGQTLLFPPNVAGWKGDKAWIDSATMVFRISLPKVLFQGETPFLTPKAEFAIENKGFFNRKMEQLSVGYDVSQLMRYFGSHARSGDLPLALAEFLLQPSISRQAQNIIAKNTNTNSPNELFNNALMTILSLPEYQLC